MQVTGIIRRVDDLGRVVIPKEVRRTAGIYEGTPMEIFITSDGILLKKYCPEINLVELVQQLDDSVEDASIDLDSNKMEIIRRAIKKIKKVLQTGN